ncbi:ester cyclase [Ruania alba]|uniref:ester cyclase n=1 Tax=Ruania alba TaxID=648782 RepID=UPI0015872EA1|nr:ester cyclase [Ruania alba]
MTTLDRLESAISDYGGIRHIARVDQTSVARTGGARVAPAEVLIIENPALVAQVASVDLELLVDLPIRVHVWQAPGGRTRVRTAQPSQIAASSDHPTVRQVRHAIETILGAWLDFAVSDAEQVDLPAQSGETGELGEGRREMVLPDSSSPRELAARFHPNFNSRRLDRNGERTAEDVVVNSNGVHVYGRDSFVQRLSRYETPFPGLQLRDRIIIEDDRSAAVLYVLQGAHGGPFAGIDATGNQVEAYSGEIFDFNEQGLLAHLLTVTHLGHLKEQVHGHREVSDHEQVTLLPVVPVSAAMGESVTAAARSLYDCEGGDSGTPVIDPETIVILDGTPERGPKAWKARLDAWQTALPDLVVTVERVLADGNRRVVSLLARGTHRGPYAIGGEEPLPPTEKFVEFRMMDFLEFSEAGRLVEVVSIYNTHDIRDQLT